MKNNSHAASKKQTASPFPPAAAAKAAPQAGSATQSPAVRRIAEETSVNPANVAGSGKQLQLEFSSPPLQFELISETS